MMPDRLVRTSDGVLGGTMTVLALAEIVMGLTWWLWPSGLRAVAAAQVPALAPFPFTVGAGLVAWGVAGVVFALLSRRAWCEVMAAVSITLPHVITVILYAASYGQTRNGNGVVTYLVLAGVGTYVATRHLKGRAVPVEREE